MRGKEMEKGMCEKGGQRECNVNWKTWKRGKAGNEKHISYFIFVSLFVSCSCDLINPAERKIMIKLRDNFKFSYTNIR